MSNGAESYCITHGETKAAAATERIDVFRIDDRAAASAAAAAAKLIVFRRRRCRYSCFVARPLAIRPPPRQKVSYSSRVALRSLISRTSRRRGPVTADADGGGRG